MISLVVVKSYPAACMGRQIIRPGFGRLQMFKYQRFQSHVKVLVGSRMVNHFGVIQQWYCLSC